MKKVLSITLAALLLCGLTACKSKEPAADQGDAVLVTNDTAKNIESEPIEEVEVPVEDEGRIMRYGISMPNETPEFDAEFYSQPVEYYTDDVLAENRDKLEMVPASSKSILNRFTEYLNTAEPGEHADGVQMTWFYIEAYSGDEDTETEYCRLVQVPFPVFEGGDVQMSGYSVTGAQSGVIYNSSYINNGSSAGDAFCVNIDSDSCIYETAEHAQESHEEFKREGLDNTIYMDYDEDSKTSVIVNKVTPAEDSIYEPARECIIFQTIAEGCGEHGADVLFNITFCMNGEPALSETDLDALRNYFEYAGIKFPDDTAWNIQ